MNLKPEFALEVFRQMAFISALIGGFSFSFIGVLLSIAERQRMINSTIIIAMLAASGMIVCTLGWTMSISFTHQLTDIENPEMPLFLRQLHRFLSLIFITSILLFLVSLGLSGWIRSRTLGIISSIISTGAVLAVLWIFSYFIK